MTTMAAFDQTEYQFQDDGQGSTGTLRGTLSTQETLEVDTTYLCRVLIENPNDGSGNLNTPNFEYSTTGTSGTWIAVTTTSSVIIAVDSSPLTETDTTQRIGLGTFITPNGWVTEVGTMATLNFVSLDECEGLLAFQIVGADVTDNQEIHLRMANMDTYSDWPDIDVNKPSGARRVMVIS